MQSQQLLKLFIFILTMIKAQSIHSGSFDDITSAHDQAHVDTPSTSQEKEMMEPSASSSSSCENNDPNNTKENNDYCLKREATQSTLSSKSSNGGNDEDNVETLSKTVSKTATETATEEQVPSQQDENAERKLEWKETKESRMFDKAKEETGFNAIMDALSDEEKKSMSDANLCLRHFRADKGDLKKAIKRTKYAIKWRNEFEVDKIVNAIHNPTTDEDRKLRSTMKHEGSSGKVYARGYDKEGRVILYFYPVRENTYDGKLNIMHLVYQIERGIACTEKNGLEKFIIIMDFEGWTMKNSPPMSVTKETIHVVQECYVERLARVYMTNAPFMFRTFWSMVKPFIDPVTKEKIIFCSGKGKERLKTDFDREALEKCALGTEDLRPFDAEEYFSKPFDTTFDETE